MRAPLLLTLAALAAACGPTFEEQSEIRRVRVLAIQAEPAELTLDPDNPVLPPPIQFTALAVAPEERPVEVNLALCKPGNPYGTELDCFGGDGTALAENQLSLLDPGVQEVLQEAANVGTGGEPVDPNDPELREVLERGVPLFVAYRASDGTQVPEGQERGVRQLTFRLTSTPNQNPQIEELLVGEEPLTGPLPLNTEVVLRPRLAEGSLEVYETADGPRTEQLFYSWFATGDGDVQQLRSLEPVDGKPGEPTSTYLTPSTPQRVTFYVVARDGRGGVAWLARTVDVVP